MSVRLLFEIDGRRLTVELDDPTLAPPLSALFRGYRLPPEAGAGLAPDVTVTVHSMDAGFTVTDAGGHARACATFGELLAEVETACTEAFLGLAAPMIPLHASGAAVNGRAVLALGAPGAGKSTLAVSWHRAGFPVLGDDVILLDEDGVVHPFKRLFGIDADMLAALGVDPATTPFWEVGADEAWYDGGIGAGWAAPAPVGTIAVVRHRAGAGTTLEPLAPLELLNALVHSQLITVAERTRGFDRLARIAASVPAYRMTFESAPDAAATLAAQLLP